MVVSNIPTIFIPLPVSSFLLEGEGEGDGCIRELKVNQACHVKSDISVHSTFCLRVLLNHTVSGTSEHLLLVHCFSVKSEVMPIKFHKSCTGIIF